MPPADIRQLRDLMRYRFKLICFMPSEKNRLQNCLTVSNIQLASVVSDTFGENSQRILALAAPYQHELDLILTSPSFKDRFTAIGILSEIGADMESAGKKKSVRVSRAECYIKPLLGQCSNAVVTSEKHPEIRNRYLRLRKRRDHKKAIIAIARMLLTVLYHMFKNKEPYNAELYRKSDVLPVNREITVEQAILLF